MKIKICWLYILFFFIHCENKIETISSRQIDKSKCLICYKNKISLNGSEWNLYAIRYLNYNTSIFKYYNIEKIKIKIKNNIIFKDREIVGNIHNNGDLILYNLDTLNGNYCYRYLYGKLSALSCIKTNKYVGDIKLYFKNEDSLEYYRIKDSSLLDYLIKEQDK